MPRMVEVLQQPGHVLLAAGPEQALHALLYATGIKAIVVMLLIVQVIDCIDHRHRKPAVAGHFGHMTVKHVKCVHDNDRIVRAGLQRLQESGIGQRVKPEVGGRFLALEHVWIAGQRPVGLLSEVVVQIQLLRHVIAPFGHVARQILLQFVRHPLLLIREQIRHLRDIRFGHAHGKDLRARLLAGLEPDAVAEHMLLALRAHCGQIDVHGLRISQFHVVSAHAHRIHVVAPSADVIAGHVRVLHHRRGRGLSFAQSSKLLPLALVKPLDNLAARLTKPLAVAHRLQHIQRQKIASGIQPRNGVQSGVRPLAHLLDTRVGQLGNIIVSALAPQHANSRNSLLYGHQRVAQRIELLGRHAAQRKVPSLLEDAERIVQLRALLLIDDHHQPVQHLRRFALGLVVPDCLIRLPQRGQLLAHLRRLFGHFALARRAAPIDVQSFEQRKQVVLHHPGYAHALLFIAQHVDQSLRLLDYALRGLLLFDGAFLRLLVRLKARPGQIQRVLHSRCDHRTGNPFLLQQRPVVCKRALIRSRVVFLARSLHILGQLAEAHLRARGHTLAARHLHAGLLADQFAIIGHRAVVSLRIAQLLRLGKALGDFLELRHLGLLLRLQLRVIGLLHTALDLLCAAVELLAGLLRARNGQRVPLNPQAQVNRRRVHVHAKVVGIDRLHHLLKRHQRVDLVAFNRIRRENLRVHRRELIPARLKRHTLIGQLHRTHQRPAELVVAAVDARRLGLLALG